MTGYVARRGLHAVPVILGITFLAFLLIRLTPGDPVTLMLGLRATPDSVAFWHVKFALDDPLPLQYLAFLRSAVTLDFGDSIASRIPVTDLIGSRLGTTLSLMVYSVLISISVAVPLAMWAALRANRMSDHGIKLTMMLTFAMPAFWVGLILIQVFSLRLDWFPASGLRQGVLPYIWSLTLPSVTIALYLSPVLVRSLRTTMISILRTDYVEAARARGLSEARVMRRYVLRNSLTSTVTMIGLSVAGLIGGSLIVENVFALPGIGQLVVQSVNARDFPVLQACVLLIGLWIILANLIDGPGQCAPRSPDTAVTAQADYGVTRVRWIRLARFPAGSRALAVGLFIVLGMTLLSLFAPGCPCPIRSNRTSRTGSSRPRSPTPSEPTTSDGTCSRGSSTADKWTSCWGSSRPPARCSSA